MQEQDISAVLRIKCVRIGEQDGTGFAGLPDERLIGQDVWRHIAGLQDRLSVRRSDGERP